MAKKNPTTKESARKKQALADSRNTEQPIESVNSKAVPLKSLRQRQDCVVVGVGASAGGLEAYKNLLHKIPDDTGMAFVLVQPRGQTVTAENGKEAIELWKKMQACGEVPAIILMDMQMPILDGVQATFQLRELGCKEPIIALTANVLQADRQACLDAGSNDFVVAGPLDSIDRRALEITMQQVREFLGQQFPDFRFELDSLRRSELDGGPRVEPSRLLQQAVQDRDNRHWDFAFVLTSAELISNYAPYCFAALSRPLDAAVFSLSLIDPAAVGEQAAESERVETIAYRLSRLIVHALGHLGGLARTTSPDNVMYRPAEAGDLDKMHLLHSDQKKKLHQSLSEIADQRLEESRGVRFSAVGFAARAAWINRREIAEAIVAARPWEFPQRLSRLTIASVSTIVVLYLTAEAWDLALSQSWLQILSLVLSALLATTAYVVVRQQLLIRRGNRRSEQMVVTSASALGTVLAGMLVTWTGLLAVGWVVASLLFRRTLIANWAASSAFEPAELGFLETCKMGLFAASLGLLIGALGASFEAQNYFRHVIFVDEEI